MRDLLDRDGSTPAAAGDESSDDAPGTRKGRLAALLDDDGEDDVPEWCQTPEHGSR